MGHDNPWAGLWSSQSGHLHAKRVDPTHPHNFFWACNPEGKYAYLLNLADPLGEWPASLELKGISVHLYPEQKQLQLVLADRSDWEIFSLLCRDLMECCRGLATTSEVMDALAARLARWQRMLMRGPRRILDEREIRGLVGELLFMRDELLPRIGPKAAACWQGFDGKPQDFVVGGTLFEIKTIRTGDAPKVQISSTDQLWSGGWPLYLQLIPLATCGAHAAGAVTLPILVNDLRRSFAGTDGMDAFDKGLVAAGYTPLPEYEDIAFTVGAPSCYELKDGFPFIGPELLPKGVVEVKYSILVAACEAFRASPNWVSIVEKVK